MVSFLFSFPSSTSILKLAWFQGYVCFILYIENLWVDIVLPQRLFLIFLKQWAILLLGNLFSCFAFLLLYFVVALKVLFAILLQNHFIAFDEVGECIGGNERASDQHAWLTAYKPCTFFRLTWFWLENTGLLLLLQFLWNIYNIRLVLKWGLKSNWSTWELAVVINHIMSEVLLLLQVIWLVFLVMSQLGKRTRRLRQLFWGS